MFKTLFFIFITGVNSFISPRVVHRRSIIRNLQIDNDTPSFIAQSIYKKFSTYGAPWTFTTFKEQLDTNQIQGVSFISENDNVKGLLINWVLNKQKSIVVPLILSNTTLRIFLG